MALAIYVPDEAVLALGQQTTWGTVHADSSNFNNSNTVNGHQLKVDKPAIEADVKLRNDETARGVRYKDVADLVRDETGANPKIKLPDHNARKLCLPLLLASHFQYVVEGAATPYKKTFTYHATQPDFTANAGYFLTGLLKMPIASQSIKAKDLIGSALNFKCAPGGVLQVGADLTGRGALTLTSNPSGTWSVLSPASTTAMNYYPFEKIDRYSINFAGAVSLGVGAFEINLTKELKPMGQASGVNQSWALSKYGGTFKGSFIWNADAAIFLSSYPAGTACAINISWGNVTPGTVDGDLDFAIYGVLNKASINPADALMIDAEFEIAGSVGGTIQPITVIIADAVDKAW
jgi:hypothetical protein